MSYWRLDSVHKGPSKQNFYVFFVVSHKAVEHLPLSPFAHTRAHARTHAHTHKRDAWGVTYNRLMSWEWQSLYVSWWRHNEALSVSLAWKHRPTGGTNNGAASDVRRHDVQMSSLLHSSDVHCTTMTASQITSVSIVYSTVYSGADIKNIKAPRHWPLWGEFTGDRWIPLTKGQWRWKCFHLMTSSSILFALIQLHIICIGHDL